MAILSIGWCILLLGVLQPATGAPSGDEVTALPGVCVDGGRRDGVCVCVCGWMGGGRGDEEKGGWSGKWKLGKERAKIWCVGCAGRWRVLKARVCACVCVRACVCMCVRVVLSVSLEACPFESGRKVSLVFSVPFSTLRSFAPFSLPPLFFNGA